jgi:aspartate kinase
MDDQEDKTTLLAVAASEAFIIDIEKGFTLLTIRHYNDALVAQLLDQKNIQLLQRDKKNMQASYK